MCTPHSPAKKSNPVTLEVGVVKDTEFPGPDLDLPGQGGNLIQSNNRKIPSKGKKKRRRTALALLVTVPIIACFKRLVEFKWGRLKGLLKWLWL